jgi:integrase/recombinase XerD
MMSLPWRRVISRQEETIMANGFSRVPGPLAPYAAGFADELAATGYTRQSVCRHVRLMADVSRWLGTAGDRMLDPVGAQAFLVSRRRDGRRRQVTAKMLEPLMDYLRRAGVTPPAGGVQSVSEADAVLRRYRIWLVMVRGVSAPCVRNRECVIRPFLDSRATSNGGHVALDRLTACDVHGYLLAEAARRRGKGASCVVSALRTFLRFLHVEGVISSPLAQAVPPVAGWTLAGLPTAFNAEHVRALLDTCKRNTVAGRRDMAVLSLLVRLGLRGGEVAGLLLDDIDWRTGEITIRGKGGRHDRLPLPSDVGDTLAAYLSGGRPGTAQGRAVFVRIKAPHRELTTAGVSNIVRRACRRAGLDDVGAHCLRHSAATAMLAAGAPLTEIGQVLRHARPLTTAVYAKVDLQSLRGLARPWPQEDQQ